MDLYVAGWIIGTIVIQISLLWAYRLNSQLKNEKMRKVNIYFIIFGSIYWPMFFLALVAIAASVATAFIFAYLSEKLSKLF